MTVEHNPRRRTVRGRLAATVVGTVVGALTSLVTIGAFAAPASNAASNDTASTTSQAGRHGHCSPDPDLPKHQMRGVWIASVANIDWPSRPGLSESEAKAELLDRYKTATDRGLNSVVVQVRPTADTFWPSELEPWSHWLTGEQGADPGWDPMQFAVDEAHARGLDFHAWFNPYRVSNTSTDPATLSPEHPGRQNPDWLVPYGGKLYYNPGVPEAREHTVDVMMEAIERYDVDGVHFDDYFYPYPVAGEEFDDAAAFAEYGGDFDDIGDWRRDNVTQLIRDLDERIHDIKPEVSFGVSPFAVWRNVATDPEGSDTTAGAQTYDDLYADTRLWVREELIDYVVPQIYWSIGFEPAAYDVLVPWWNEVVDGTDVDLFIGQATYKVGTSTQSPEWADPQEMVRHLDLNQNYSNVAGDVYFSEKDVLANRLGHMDLVEEAHYQRPALPPITTDARVKVKAPNWVSARRTNDGNQVSWRRHGESDGYAVYRLPAKPGRDDRCALADASNLVAVLGPDETSWTDPEGGAARYVITTISSTNSESHPSRAARVR